MIFWDKQVGDHYLAYVACDSITAPTCLGGLSIRDLNRMNEALLMKASRRLAAKEEPLWVKIVKAKYMPRSNLWDSKRIYKCTLFWRNLHSQSCFPCCPTKLVIEKAVWCTDNPSSRGQWSTEGLQWRI